MTEREPEYNIPNLGDFTIEQEMIRNGELTETIEFGAWRTQLPEDNPHPGHIKEVGGEQRIPTRLYGSGVSENNSPVRSITETEGIELQVDIASNILQ